MREANVNTIYGNTKLIESFRRTNILLHIGTKFIIEDTLFFTKSQRNLLSFKDIRLNGYHIESQRNLLSFKDIRLNGYHIETMNEEILNISTLHQLSRVRNMYWKNYPFYSLDCTTQISECLKLMLQ